MKATFFVLLLTAGFLGQARAEDSIVRPSLLDSATPPEFTANQRPHVLRTSPMGSPQWARSGEIFIDVGNGRVVVASARDGRVLRELDDKQGKWDVTPRGDAMCAYGQLHGSGAVFVADTSSGEIRWEHEASTYPSAMRFSADGGRLVVVSRNPRASECRVEMLDVLTGKTVRDIALKQFPKEISSDAIALVRERFLIFATGIDYQPMVVDLASGEGVALRVRGGEGIPGTERSVSRDGRFLASIHNDGWGHGRVAAFYEILPSGEMVELLRRESSGEEDIFHEAAFSENGVCAISCRTRIRTFDLRKKEERAVLPMGATELALSPDGSRLVFFCGARMEIAAADEARDSPREAGDSEGWSPEAFAINAEGTLLAANDDDEIVLWKIGQEKPLARIRNPGEYALSPPAFEPHRDAMFAGDSMEIWRWSLNALANPAPFDFLHWDKGPFSPFKYSFSTDGRTMGVVRFGSAWVVEAPGEDSAVPSNIRTLALEGRPSACDLENSAFSADMKHFAFYSDRRVQLYQLDPESLAGEIEISGEPLAYAPDLRWFAMTSTADDIVIVDMETGREKARLAWSEEAGRHHLGEHFKGTVCEDGSLLAVGFGDPFDPTYGAAIFEVETGRLVQVIRTQRGIPMQISFAQNNRKLAVANQDGTIQIFAVRAGEIDENQASAETKRATSE